MHPVLLRIGPFPVSSYGILLVVAFLVAVGLACRDARRLPHLGQLTDKQIVDFMCYALLGGILGGRLLYVAIHWGSFAQAPHEVLAIWHGGLVWYGGFLGGVLTGWFYARATGVSFLRGADQAAPYVALGHAIGRIGCFLNGCCYGVATTAWCGVVFPGDRVARLPTQLVESVGLFGLFGFLYTLRWRGRRDGPGWLFGVYLIGYAILRFAVEFVRGDQPRWWMGLTPQQLISVGILLVGSVLLTAGSRRR